ncbi:Proline--tRNA ligase [Planctomycetales bacterium 10988]|nr:Proline--tRNA ligase [Planctomycetales bacterium 10988]
MNPTFWLISGGILGLLGVGLGAFGAHGLESETWHQRLGWDSPEMVQKNLETFETAVRYQMYHVPALILVGLWAAWRPSRWLTASGICFLLGILIFSGLLYALVFSGVKILGAIVPIGGVLLMVGWFLLSIAGCQTSPLPAPDSEVDLEYEKTA